MNKIEVSKLKHYQTVYSEQEKIGYLFQISTDYAKTFLDLGFHFNYATMKLEGTLPLNDTELKVTIYKDADSHAKRYTMAIRDKNNNTYKDVKGTSSYQIYYPLTTKRSEITLTEMFHYLSNFIQLNSKEKDTFKQFVENEKA